MNRRQSLSAAELKIAPTGGGTSAGKLTRHLATALCVAVAGAAYAQDRVEPPTAETPSVTLSQESPGAAAIAAPTSGAQTESAPAVTAEVPPAAPTQAAPSAASEPAQAAEVAPKTEPMAEPAAQAVAPVEAAKPETATAGAAEAAEPVAKVAVPESVQPGETGREVAAEPVPTAANSVQQARETAPVAAQPVQDVAAPSQEVRDAAPSADRPTVAVEAPAPAAPAASPDAATQAAETPTTAPDPAMKQAASAEAGADPVLVAGIRELVESRLDRIADRRNDRAGIESFYRERDFQPIWIEQGAKSPRAEAAIRFLRAVDADGLDPAEYRIPSFGGDAEALAAAELELTASVVAFARHASIGRVHYTRIAGDIEYQLEAPNPSDVLSNVAKATDVAVALDSYHPPHEGYRALRAELAKLRAATEEPKVVRVPDGPTLRLGMQDERVPVLRQRLNVAGEPDSRHYDETMVEAVRRFQQSAGLKPDGLFGPASLRAINGGAKSPANLIDVVIANMERWRWMPRDLGRAHVMVNIPDFSVRVMRDGNKLWQTKIVVGRTSRATPIISTQMRSITVNPTWNVPPGIMANDYMPVLRQDPSALSRIGVRVERNADGTVRMYQPPGDRNALGRLRFNTPNRFLVYLHDTPDRHLFQRDVRAYSSGCMRVENPLRFAEVLLSIAQPDQRHTQESIRRMYGPSERNLGFGSTIPVHLTYQTAFVDADGKLQFRADVYGHDTRIAQVLNGSDRRVADIAVPRRNTNVNRDELRIDERTFASSRNRNYGSPFSPYYYGPRRDFGSGDADGPVRNFFSLFR